MPEQERLNYSLLVDPLLMGASMLPIRKENRLYQPFFPTEYRTWGHPPTMFVNQRFSQLSQDMRRPLCRTNALNYGRGIALSKAVYPPKTVWRRTTPMILCSRNIVFFTSHTCWSLSLESVHLQLQLQGQLSAFDVAIFVSGSS